jgi:response regulator RpfG family c-di-GMP phosphodiesterase
MKSHSATVESIALVSAIRDDETGEHLKRTKIYIKELACYLLKKRKYTHILNRKYIDLIYQAAPLHDIGKLGIPDSILKKPARLTKKEYEIMKQHPILAKNAIEKAMKYDKNDFLNIAYNIAYYHHEKWDGSGYPVGLKGDDIPLEAQLMAIADVYDALVTKRCYKNEFSFEEAEKIIIDGSGSHFNPLLVEAFIALKDRFKEIAIKYRDNYSDA